jgi:hypothetical protein
MANFASLKKTSSDLSRLTKEIDKINTPQSTEREVDNRFWKLDRDKSGNGSAVIRFLPAPAVDGDDGLPWVRYFDHGFKGPSGKWYIENSLTTIGQKDPVSEYNSQLWNASSDDNSWQRKQARDQKRRLHYIANIMVVSDSKHPENEGKVFLFKFGKKIFDKITLAMNPEFEGDKPVNPFDLWKGANFKLRTRMVAGYLNYDQSAFDNPSTLSDDDDELEKIWKREYSLKEFTDPKNFKTYDELKKRLTEVLGETIETESTSMHQSKKVFADSKPTFEASKPRKSVEDTPPFDTDSEDEDLNYFKGLADD